jgi:sulfate adenylyltransferase subunit 2
VSDLAGALEPNMQDLRNSPTGIAKMPAERLPKHLRQLEAESIQVMREVVAELKKPVMLYSIGKDSSVMLHLAIKAFYPGPLPFPLLHVDTTWKFREMIAFRNETALRLGVDLIIHINQDGLDRSVDPFVSGSRRSTNLASMPR